MAKKIGGPNIYSSWEAASRASEKELTKIKSGLAASSRKVEPSKVSKWFRQAKARIMTLLGFAPKRSEISAPYRSWGARVLNPRYKTWTKVGPGAKHPGAFQSADKVRNRKKKPPPPPRTSASPTRTPPSPPPRKVPPPPPRASVSQEAKRPKLPSRPPPKLSDFRPLPKRPPH